MPIVQHQISAGHAGLLAVNAGFVVCEEHPFLGASPDAYVNDPTSTDQFSLAEIKCPYKYCNLSPESSAMNSNPGPTSYHRQKVVRLHCIHH